MFSPSKKKVLKKIINTWKLKIITIIRQGLSLDRSLRMIVQAKSKIIKARR